MAEAIYISYSLAKHGNLQLIKSYFIQTLGKIFAYSQMT